MKGMRLCGEGMGSIIRRGLYYLYLYIGNTRSKRKKRKKEKKGKKERRTKKKKRNKIAGPEQSRSSGELISARLIMFGGLCFPTRDDSIMAGFGWMHAGQGLWFRRGPMRRMGEKV